MIVLGRYKSSAYGRVCVCALYKYTHSHTKISLFTCVYLPRLTSFTAVTLCLRNVNPVQPWCWCAHFYVCVCINARTNMYLTPNRYPTTQASACARKDGTAGVLTVVHIWMNLHTIMYVCIYIHRRMYIYIHTYIYIHINISYICIYMYL